MPPVIAPSAHHDDAWFWDGVRDGRLLLRACGSCLRLQHPPTPLCPACGSRDWVTRQASGRGTVYSWIVSHHPTQPDVHRRIVVLVELEEGARLVSNLCDVDVGEVYNGMAVEVCFVELEGGVTLPQFRPAGHP